MATTHLLDFICEGYTGNFSQELVSYVFGQEDWENSNRDFHKYLLPEELAEIDEQLGDREDEAFTEGFYDEYGISFVELGQAPHPTTGEPNNTVRVRVSEKNWHDHMDAQAIQGLKNRAVKFFEIYLAHLPSRQLREGAFLGLSHTVVTAEELTEQL